MAWTLDGQTPAVEQALAGGSRQSVGWFRFSFTEMRWEWSEQVQRMHGYEPGTLVRPTVEQVLSHKHPDDRERVAAGIDEMLNTRQGFSTRHRIIDTHGAVHEVVVAGDQLLDENGEVVGIRGFYIDLTSEFEDRHQDVITAKVAEIAERRAVIEQAKGMLMLVYRIDDAAAFDLLKWLSQENNIKLQLLARQVAKDFVGVSETAVGSRATFDQLLLTAHSRAGSAAEAKDHSASNR
jgi:PAS domain S-box-containing protein